MGPNIKLNLLLGLVGLMLGGGAAFREMTDDSHSSEVGEAGCPAPARMTPELAQDKAGEIINLPFGKPQIMAPWTIQVSNGHHLGNRWI